jgi:hypothetical protein
MVLPAPEAAALPGALLADVVLDFALLQATSSAVDKVTNISAVIDLRYGELMGSPFLCWRIERDRDETVV